MWLTIPPAVNILVYIGTEESDLDFGTRSQKQHQIRETVWNDFRHAKQMSWNWFGYRRFQTKRRCYHISHRIINVVHWKFCLLSLKRTRAECLRPFSKILLCYVASFTGSHFRGWTIIQYHPDTLSSSLLTRKAFRSLSLKDGLGNHLSNDFPERDSVATISAEREMGDATFTMHQRITIPEHI